MLCFFRILFFLVFFILCKNNHKGEEKNQLINTVDNPDTKVQQLLKERSKIISKKRIVNTKTKTKDKNLKYLFQQTLPQHNHLLLSYTLLNI